MQSTTLLGKLRWVAAEGVWLAVATHYKQQSAGCLDGRRLAHHTQPECLKSRSGIRHYLANEEGAEGCNRILSPSTWLMSEQERARGSQVPSEVPGAREPEVSLEQDVRRSSSRRL
jgi:hypothetical protein